MNINFHLSETTIKTFLRIILKIKLKNLFRDKMYPIYNIIFTSVINFFKKYPRQELSIFAMFLYFKGNYEFALKQSISSVGALQIPLCHAQKIFRLFFLKSKLRFVQTF